ncbi:MAG TPA: hypothetical protein VFA90_14620 [Terriglobales bacterium]|nr:hypothetical protein [Terriglobales bacterium]
MPERRNIAIIAALERELRPLIKTWSKSNFTHQGREFTAYESNYAVAICGGIGAEHARRAAEAAVAQYSPEILVSAGVAGATVPELHVGETVFPSLVVDTLDGSRHKTDINSAVLAGTPLARAVLASSESIASPTLKRQLAKSYGAHAVDMEAAAVTRAAQKHNLRFVAIKTISDDVDFNIPELSRFVRRGEFATGAFVLYVIPRPWLWLKVIELGRDTKAASRNLCAWLRESALTNTIVPGARSPSKS